jgi:hypothetical protein
MYEYNSNNPGHLWGEPSAAGASAGTGAGVTATATAAAVGGGARAFVPPASSPYIDAPGSPQQATNDGYYYATAGGNTYSQQGEDDFYNHDGQYAVNNAYYNGGYQDGNLTGNGGYEDYGYFSHESYSGGAVGLVGAGATFGSANPAAMQSSSGTDPHSVYSKPDAKE